MKTTPSWKDWFPFSKRDRNAFFILLFACILYCLILFFYQPSTEQPVVKNLDEALAELSSQNVDSNASQPDLFSHSLSSSPSSTEQLVLFYFDPNTLDEAGFQRLGLRDKTIHTIINYRTKGGHFYKPDDLRKIYGLKEEEAGRLVPYVRINGSQTRTTIAEQDDENHNGSRPFYAKTKPQLIDINTATADQWKSLPAIGDVLSGRIVKYRDKIGGFASIEDVKKVYGISDSSFQIILPYLKISTNKTSVKTESSKAASPKININTASVNELKSNPAISSDIAEAIVIYRRQHGNYASVEAIKKIVFINDEIYQTIAPYLTVD